MLHVPAYFGIGISTQTPESVTHFRPTLASSHCDRRLLFGITFGVFVWIGLSIEENLNLRD